MAVPLVVLIVLDGWGLAPSSESNAISLAKTPNMDKFWAGFPHTQLEASGEVVGLPRGEAGSTETGHLNLGAGQIVYQDLPRINIAIANGTFFENPVFLKALEHAKTNGSKLHLMGLLGTGSVHSSKEHLYALLRLCKDQGFKNLFIHLFTDGRDSPPTAALSAIEELERITSEEGVGRIATVMGRYWAMDRDFRWERTARAYFALTQGKGVLVKDIKDAIGQSYERGITDEFIEPSIVTADKEKPLALIEPNDSVIFYNFRIDRPRQLTKAFVWDNLDESAQKEWGFDPYAVKYEKKHEPPIPPTKPFERGPKIDNLFFVTMTEYGKPLADKTNVAFPPVQVKHPLGLVIAQKGVKQLRVAESEKERFVTFYFNGQNEVKFPGEDWIIVESPKVETYDQKPEMAAEQITQAVLERLETSPIFKFILINFANPDMLAHTGNKEATIKGCEVVDAMVGKIVAKVSAVGGVTLITGDHGNAEQIINPYTNQADTEHTTNPVPFIAVGSRFVGKGKMLQLGMLADVAPTVLELLGINPSSTMTGRNLLDLDLL